MLHNIRKDYLRFALNEEQLNNNPVAQFQTWLQEAIADGANEPTAMVLSTVVGNQPDSRVVLLKEVSDGQFVFFTNYESTKGEQLNKNPLVSLNFFWKEQERQIRIKGEAQKISPGDSEHYFLSRPTDSQFGAWASQQSKEIENRKILQERLDEIKSRFAHEPIVCPPFWGGYAVSPHEIEFWQGRANRLHDRFRYTKEGDRWRIARLSP